MEVELKVRLHGWIEQSDFYPEDTKNFPVPEEEIAINLSKYGAIRLEGRVAEEKFTIDDIDSYLSDDDELVCYELNPRHAILKILKSFKSYLEKNDNKLKVFSFSYKIKMPNSENKYIIRITKEINSKKLFIIYNINKLKAYVIIAEKNERFRCGPYGIRNELRRAFQSYGSTRMKEYLKNYSENYSIRMQNPNKWFEDIIRQIPAGIKFSEKEINEILVNITKNGDYASVRRSLIDNGYLKRTNNCREYWRETKAEEQK